jgi:hypothetical protein
MLVCGHAVRADTGRYQLGTFESFSTIDGLVEHYGCVSLCLYLSPCSKYAFLCANKGWGLLRVPIGNII